MPRSCPAQPRPSFRSPSTPIRSFPDLYALCVSASSFPSLSPLPATLANCPQLHENTATLSPVFATLTDCVKHKSFVCHSYRKHGGWGVPSTKQIPIIHARYQLNAWRRDALPASAFVHRLLRHEDTDIECGG